MLDAPARLLFSGNGGLALILRHPLVSFHRALSDLLNDGLARPTNPLP